VKHGAIIILEGVDKTGKTTEADRLERVIPAVYNGLKVNRVKFGVPERVSPYDEYRRALQVADREDEAVTVIDRMHWSHMVYQAEYRPEHTVVNGVRTRERTWMDKHSFDLLEALAVKVGAYVVLKTRTVENIVAAMDDEDYGEADAKRVSRMLNHYQELYLRSPISGSLISFDRPIGDDILREAAARRTAALAAWSE
jgi:hypothetical protein